MSRKSAKSAPEPKVIFPPKSHVSVESFLKELGLKSKSGRADALEILARSMVDVPDDDFSSASDSTDLSGLDSDEVSARCCEEADSDAAAGRKDYGTALAGEDRVLVSHPQGLSMQYSRTTLKNVCQILSLETGSVEKGLDVTYSAISSLTLAQGAVETEAGQFIDLKRAEKSLGSGTSRQWVYAINRLAVYFPGPKREIKLFSHAGETRLLSQKIYPRWLLEVLFALKDRQQVTRMFLMPDK